MYYFAYGTLLDIDVMRRIAPTVRSHGIMRLDGYYMDFGRCADIEHNGCTLVPDEGAVTFGIQYELSDQEMAEMDGMAVSGCELWVHKPIKLVNGAGHQVDSITYTIPGDITPIAPTDDYVRPILKGLDDLDFTPEYVSRMKTLITNAQNRT